MDAFGSRSAIVAASVGRTLRPSATAPVLMPGPAPLGTGVGDRERREACETAAAIATEDGTADATLTAAAAALCAGAELSLLLAGAVCASDTRAVWARWEAVGCNKDESDETRADAGAGATVLRPSTATEVDAFTGWDLAETAAKCLGASNPGRVYEAAMWPARGMVGRDEAKEVAEAEELATSLGSTIDLRAEAAVAVAVDREEPNAL
jgi:hypothetical protein